MQWTAAIRNWWRRNDHWAKFSFPMLVAVVGAAANLSFVMAHATMLMSGAIILVVLMVAIDRVLSSIVRERH